MCDSCPWPTDAPVPLGMLLHIIPSDISPSNGAETESAFRRSPQYLQLWVSGVPFSWKASFGDKRVTSLVNLADLDCSASWVVLVGNLSMETRPRFATPSGLCFRNRGYLIKPSKRYCWLRTHCVCGSRRADASLRGGRGRDDLVVGVGADALFIIIQEKLPLELRHRFIATASLISFRYLSLSLEAQCEFQHKLKSALRFPKSKK